MFLGSLAPLHAAAAGPAPLLRDRRLKLVPAAGGFRLPAHYHWLLLPFSKRKVPGPALTFCRFIPVAAELPDFYL